MHRKFRFTLLQLKQYPSENGFSGYRQLHKNTTEPCRSEPARDSVGPVDINIEGATAIASRLAPTRIVSFEDTKKRPASKRKRAVFIQALAQRTRSTHYLFRRKSASAAAKRCSMPAVGVPILLTK